MTKVLKNFYVKGLIAALAVFFVFYFAFGAVFSSFVPAFKNRIAEAEKAAEEAKMAVLTGGSETSVLEGVTFVDGVSEVLSTSDGGYIVTASAQGAEGPVVLSIRLGADGAVNTVVVSEAEEAPEYGGKALQEAYLSKYAGLTDTAGVEAFTGATYTSNAIRECVDKALLQLQVINGVEYEAPLSGDELQQAILTENLGEDYVRAEVPELADSVVEVYASDKGWGMVTEEQGAGGPIRLVVYMDKDGVVRNIVPVFHTEPVGRGDQYLTESYLFFYEGYSAYGYFDDGSGCYVFNAFDDTNLAMAKMLLGSVKQFAIMNPAEEA